jgi:3-methyladenine DNA glycosylase AlkC
MAEKVLLKDQLFTKQGIEHIAEEIQQVFPTFQKKEFVKKVIEKFPQLELTPRIKWIRENLRIFLPQDYRKATEILLKSLPKHTDTDTLDSDFGNFLYAPYSDFVAIYGCSKENLAYSLDALKEMTKRFSAEDAIRYFINAFPKETFAQLVKWSSDSDYHIRRLTSEGTRPLLPWSARIRTPVDYAVPILDNLYNDKSRFVTRSVANHLNDISKIDPSLVFTTLKRWQKSGKQDEKETEYIAKQALRTLIKKGHADAMTFYNLSANPQVTISNFSITDKVTIGDFVTFSFILQAKKEEQLFIDYILYFYNKAGKGYNKKIFQLKRMMLQKGETVTILKKHRMWHFSTRRLYPGKHKIEIQMNGKIVAGREFALLK